MPNDPHTLGVIKDMASGFNTPTQQQPATPPTAPAVPGGGPSLWQALTNYFSPQETSPYQNFANKATGRPSK